MRPLIPVLVGILTICAGVQVSRATTAADHPRRQEASATSQRTDPGIAFLEERTARDPDDIIALNMLADRYLDRLQAGGDDGDLTLATKAVQRSLGAVPAELNGGAIEVEVRVNHASHRFEEAREGAARLVASMPSEGSYHALLGNALLELGRVEEASAAFVTAEKLDGRQVQTESRFAQIAILRGQNERGLQHLHAALDLAEAYSPAAPVLLAWCHAQIGQYWFSRGRWSEAEQEYQLALAAVPDDLLTLEHLAELAAARGDYATAIVGYQEVIARSRRPEFRQALGDVLSFANKPIEAQRWYDEALAGYMHSVRSGYVHYYHHLAGFFSDSRPDGKAAVDWARKDLALRRSVGAYDAMAWALYVDGQIDAAAEAAVQVLSLGTDDAHLLYHAGLIASRQGNIERGAELLRQAVKANPHHNSFHVHR